MQSIKSLILDDLESLGLIAEVQFDSEFISTLHDTMFVGFKNAEEMNLYKIVGIVKESRDIRFEVV